MRSETKANQMMMRFCNRMQFYDISRAFQKWQQVTVACRERDGDNKRFGSQRVGQILNRLVKRRLALALHDIKRRTQKKDFKNRFLRRMFMHTAERKLRDFFERWKNFANCENIAHTVNTEGDVVMRRN